MRRYYCQTPEKCCTGSLTQIGPSGMQKKKTHSSTDEAFLCHKKYLLSQGYTQVGSREFASPNGGPIRLLRKKSKYGTPLRKGKADDKTSGRVTPLGKGQSAVFV